MAFISFFRREMPKILSDLKVNRLNLSKIQSDLERLFIMEQNYASQELRDCQYRYCIHAAIDTFGVALWIKDETHHFTFANKICCNTLLKCTEEEALNLTDADFQKNALAMECIESDKVVMESRKTMRFIEHAVYEDGEELFLDVIKSPRIEHGEIIGTIGSGVIVTDSIPKAVRDQHRKSNSIEIPVSALMSTAKLIELLERRKENGRDEKDDQKFQKFRKDNELNGEKS